MRKKSISNRLFFIPLAIALLFCVSCSGIKNNLFEIDFFLIFFCLPMTIIYPLL